MQKMILEEDFEFLEKSFRGVSESSESTVFDTTIGESNR